MHSRNAVSTCALIWIALFRFNYHEFCLTRLFARTKSSVNQGVGVLCTVALLNITYSVWGKKNLWEMLWICFNMFRFHKYIEENCRDQWEPQLFFGIVIYFCGFSYPSLFYPQCFCQQMRPSVDVQNRNSFLKIIHSLDCGPTLYKSDVL